MCYEGPTTDDIEVYQNKYEYGSHDERKDAAFRLQNAARYHYSDDDPDVFPFRTDEDGVILDLETDTLDGQRFISKTTRATDEGEDCPDCGHGTRRVATWNNGIVGGKEETCVVCNHTFVSEHG